MMKRKRQMEEAIADGRDPREDDMDQDEDGDEDSEEEQEATTNGASSSSAVTRTSGGHYVNKQRVLIISSRGITARYRHLLEDLKQLIPHHKKDNKLDTKGDVQIVNEIAEMKSCNQVLYLETRKHQDLYMHLGRCPQGPTAKFHVVNVHTMDELKLTGNCMVGSRPLLNFDTKFDSSPHWQLLKTLLNDTFGTPRGHPKSKPFVDRIMSFFVVKNNIWVRNYQILDKTDEKKKEKDTHLVEIGPRFVLVPIRIFNGSMGGATLYENQAYVSPNEERSAKNQRKGDRFVERTEDKKARKDRQDNNKPEPDPLSSNRVFRGADNSDSE